MAGHAKSAVELKPRGTNPGFGIHAEKRDNTTPRASAIGRRVRELLWAACGHPSAAEVILVLVPARKTKAAFIEPMLLYRTERLPDGTDWLYEVKFDGYRALAVKSGGKVHLRSRNDNDFAIRYAGIAKALAAMPDETVLDGEIVALDGDGRPSFNALQNYGSSSGPLLYYIFDVLILSGTDMMGETLLARRAILEKNVLPKLDEPIRYSPESRPPSRT